MKLEITLKDACYLNGVVLDANKNPLPRVVVRTDPDLGKARCATTNKEGKFHISQLEKEKIYSLVRLERHRRRSRPRSVRSAFKHGTTSF